jgi:salicylate hydroxylase
MSIVSTTSSVVSKDIEIAIIGGGLAGFAAAITLHMNGFTKITVYERDDCINRRRQGYGLTILQGITALKAIDCLEQVKQLDTPSRSHYIFDHSGNIIGFFGTIFWPTQAEHTISPKQKKKYNLHIGRQSLRNILYKKFLDISSHSNIRWNCKLEKIQQDPIDASISSIQFANGDSVKAHLVIGCDGINSFTRKNKYEPLKEPLNYLGIILVLGICYSDHPLTNKRVFQTVNGSCRIFTMPYESNEPNQNVMWQLSMPMEESKARHLSSNLIELKQFFLNICQDWHEPIPQMIESTQYELIMGIPAYDRDPVLPDESNSLKNVVLLGDAAHPMSPFKGQGANQALLDAVSFGKCLLRSQGIEKAISDFECEMMGRVRSKVMQSRERVSILHEANILNAESFDYRGASVDLLNLLKEKNINSRSGEAIEELIMNEMKFVN